MGAMNEAASFRRRSGLTQEQKFDQQAYVFGLNPEDYKMTPTATYSAEEIAIMRRILAQHDNAGRGGPNEFDLAKPPVPQYRHQDYPRAMYLHSNGDTVVALNKKHQMELEEKGYSTSPTPTIGVNEAEDAGLSAEDRAEAAELDAQIVKRGPGRPRKES